MNFLLFSCFFCFLIGIKTRPPPPAFWNGAFKLCLFPKSAELGIRLTLRLCFWLKRLLGLQPEVDTHTSTHFIWVGFLVAFGKWKICADYEYS